MFISLISKLVKMILVLGFIIVNDMNFTLYNIANDDLR